VTSRGPGTQGRPPWPEVGHVVDRLNV